MTASRRQFLQVKGLGTAKYAQVQAAMEMARRVMDEPLRQGDPLRSPADTRRFLTSRLGTYPHEVFAGLFLDNRHGRSEEHTSDLQSRPHLVCRLLLEKKKQGWTSFMN